MPGASLVTVCMPVSRSQAAVARSLASALAQTVVDLEVLVGDDGGHGAAAVDAAGDPRVRYRRNDPPLGFTANHEALLAQARGRFVAFLHDDDRWEPAYLRSALDALDREPRAGLVLTAHRELPDGRVWGHPAARDGADAVRTLLDERTRLLPSATVLRAEALAGVRRPWPQLSCGDMVLYLDVALGGWTVATVDAPLVSYERHPEQISADETRFREDLAALFELYRFADPATERLRRARVASARLASARAQLKAGRMQDARASVALARAARPSARTRAEGAALLALSRSPRLLGATLRTWYALRGLPATARSPLS